MQKNEVRVFENEELGLQVRTIFNPDGSISVSAEDTAIGFGWCRTEVKNGKEYTSVMWSRMNGYCKELGFAHECAKEDYIPESLYYLLGMKANNEKAQKYQRWLAMDVLPTLRKTGSYEMPKQKEKSQSERLASVNNAVKILTPLLEKAGCNSKIQLLTAKQLYAKAEVFLPVEIESDKRYWDTVHIARQAGICYKSSGKPADKAVNEIIRRIGVTEADYTDTWESKGKWQGTVRKYSDEVIERVICWIADNDYPTDIEYRQTDGQVKAYHVSYKNREVA